MLLIEIRIGQLDRHPIMQCEKQGHAVFLRQVVAPNQGVFLVFVQHHARLVRASWKTGLLLRAVTRAA